MDLDPKVLSAIITVALGVASGLATGSRLVLWLIERQFHSALEAIERMPPASWFSDVNAALKRIPSEDLLKRIEVLMLGGFVPHGLRLQDLEKSSDDHEARLRDLEKARRSS